jgi:Tripartite tricarboxylate transporter TctB family
VRRADQVGGLALLVFGIWYAAVALRYPYRAATGPGSGFLPFWLGVAMAALAALLLVRSSRSAEPGADWLPRGFGLRRLLLVLGITVLFVAGLKVVGMLLGTALFLLAVLRGVERHTWPRALAIAVGVALLNYLVFAHWLNVPFPVGVLGI